MMYFAFLLLVLCGGNTMADPPLIDLSLTYYLDPPTSHKINVLEKSINRIQIEVDLYQMCSSEHAGTHIEAPITFSESGLSVDEIPFERLWRVPGMLMDVSTDISPGNDITSDTLWSWESRTHQVIRDGSVLLIYTGRLQPRLTEDAARWIVNYRQREGYQKGVVGVGINLDSLDNKDSNESTSARFTLYSENIYAIHNLGNLFMLPRKGFFVTVMPMKINKGTGAPARVFAEPEQIQFPRPQYPIPRMNSSKDERSDWHSESDHRYPNPYWRIDRIAASAESSYCFNLMSLFCLLTIQYFWLKVIA